MTKGEKFVKHDGIQQASKAVVWAEPEVGLNRLNRKTLVDASGFDWFGTGLDIPPVLLLVFNRPEETMQVFQAIRHVRPKKLYVASDAARGRKVGEAEAVAAVRDLIQVDWDCEVQYLYQEENLGCRRAIIGALDWFFEHEEEGIILEDDCVPNASFWPFCAELLKRYRDDLRVATISGSNYELGRSHRNEAYYFSRHVHIWGWATWRRTWQSVDKDLTHWPEVRKHGWLTKLFGSAAVGRFWEARFDAAYRHEVDVWSYYLLFSVWAQGQVNIIPAENLISNIGFSEQATRTNRPSPYAQMPTEELSFPLIHPSLTMVDEVADAFVARRMYSAFPLPVKVWNRAVSEVNELRKRVGSNRSGRVR